MTYSIFKEPTELSGSDGNRMMFSTGFRLESERNNFADCPSLGVERKGIEPLTPGLQSRCSPS
jgi:hypothetical protein